MRSLLPRPLCEHSKNHEPKAGSFGTMLKSSGSCQIRVSDLYFRPCDYSSFQCFVTSITPLTLLRPSRKHKNVLFFSTVLEQLCTLSLAPGSCTTGYRNHGWRWVIRYIGRVSIRTSCLSDFPTEFILLFPEGRWRPGLQYP